MPRIAAERLLGQRDWKVKRVGPALALTLICAGLSWALPLAVAQAHSVSSEGTALSAARVVARQYVEPEIGAYVRARSGVSIFVPPGVMTRFGYVTITAHG